MSGANETPSKPTLELADDGTGGGGGGGKEVARKDNPTRGKASDLQGAGGGKPSDKTGGARPDNPPASGTAEGHDASAG